MNAGRLRKRPDRLEKIVRAKLDAVASPVPQGSPELAADADDVTCFAKMFDEAVANPEGLSEEESVKRFVEAMQMMDEQIRKGKC
jgi:hypothetical protein